MGKTDKVGAAFIDSEWDTITRIEDLGVFDLKLMPPVSQKEAYRIGWHSSAGEDDSTAYISNLAMED